MAIVTREFLNITGDQQITDMAAFINANKPESLSTVNVYADTTSSGNWSFLVFNLYTAISNNGRIDYQIRWNSSAPCYFNITSLNNSSYLYQLLDAYNYSHNVSFRIVCSDNCIAVICWPTAYSGVLTTQVTVITTDNHGEVCVFYNQGALFNTNNSIFPGVLSTLTKDGDTTSAQYRVVSMNFREDGSTTSVQPSRIMQTMLFNLPVWNNSQNDIRYMPHVFMASCVDQYTSTTGSIVTVGDHEYYCCLLSRIFFD